MNVQTNDGFHIAHSGHDPYEGRGKKIGMNQRELQQYSVTRALAALASDDWAGAELEQEASRAAYKESGKAQRAGGLMIPADVMERRDLEVQTNPAGGATVQTSLLSMIDILRNNLVLQRAGAMVLSGLVGSLDIPRQTGGATAYWVGEHGSPTESEQTFDQVQLRPHTVGAYTDYSRRLMLQSSVQMEQFVVNDLLAIVARAAELAFLTNDDVGGDVEAPKGLQFTPGVTDLSGTPGPLTWEKVVALETAVAQQNADVEDMAYMGNSRIVGQAKSITKNAADGMSIWVTGDPHPLNGYAFHKTNALPHNGGANSTLFFGNWADVIIALWSGLEIMIDPYTHSTSGTIRVVCLSDVDVGFRHGESFSMFTDITG